LQDTPFPNQPPPYEGRNLYACDPLLRGAVAALPGPAASALEAWGARLGSAETYAWADAANRHAPVLRTLDRRGERIDQVEFDPGWHALMALGTGAGEHCAPWAEPSPHAQRLRAAHYYLHAQVENGTQCPLTMTFAAAPVLARHGAAAGLDPHWLAAVHRADYDPRSLPVGHKRAALIGMGMTERQGGSDVRSNRTQALCDGGHWRITGHKWFFSAPQCDAHLVLAQTGEGVGCFFMPRLLDDGSRNAIRLVRLKDKLGNRSNASAEVEFDGAIAILLGEPGRGIATILQMVELTRLDCVIASAGMMRAALAWALHWATHRIAFGRRLADAPLMTNVLADLALETEAGLALALELARCFERNAAADDRARARLLVPAAKYWVCKRAPVVAAEAMEVLGGNGYIEEQPLPRLYREAPVNSIWEGSGNVICLDVARAVRREPDAVDALRESLVRMRGRNPDFDRACARLDALLGVADDPRGARRLAQTIATTSAAALLLRDAPEPIGTAYCASRLRDDALAGSAFGTLDLSCDIDAIVRRLDADA
jgi:putative acyl-CoA dehydrogenase